MFRCQHCQATTFDLMVDPTLPVTVSVALNTHHEVTVQVRSAENPAYNQDFIADLGFMNQFARCAQCGTSRQWAYDFSQTSKS